MTTRLGLYAAASAILMLGTALTNMSFAAEAAKTGILSGAVTSSKGPEAGVWVIAETRDLPTRLIKIVVTDDRGRYVLPELPAGAKYKVWVRGYGLVDSQAVETTAGNRNLNLKAVLAPSPAAAAEFYPSNYWLSLMKIPAENEFPGTGPKGNGIPPTMKSQQQWATQLKSGCLLCHQQGGASTRILEYSTAEAWRDRLRQARPEGDQTVGNHGDGIAHSMQNNMTALGSRGLEVFADWTTRVAKGEIPHETPPRPAGVERNVVLTIWDFAFGRALHDEITTDRRNPTVNAGGPVYALAPTTGKLETLDPVANQAGEFALPPLPGKEQLNVYPHNPMIDGKGRVWITDWGQYTLPKSQQSKALDREEFCSNPSNKFAKYYPMPGDTNDRRIMVFDPNTESTVSIPICFGVHHLSFDNDKNDTLYFSGDTNVVGWIETKVFDETKDPSKALGWCPMVLDTKQKAASGNVAITPDSSQWNQPQSAGRVAAGRRDKDGWCRG